MAIERTYSMIKPDAVKAGNTGNILAMIEAAGFRVLGMKKTQFTLAQAQKFYEVHKERPFYGELVEFMTSGPIVALALEKENAIKDLRELMGATNPAEAAEGTIRKNYAASIGENAIHGSDAPETAAQEIPQLFSEIELVG